MTTAVFASSLLLAVLVPQTCVLQARGDKLPRIIAGVEVESGAYGEYVAMVSQRQGAPEPSLRCGGTLIQENLVLTAAHCVVDKDPRDILFAKGNIEFTNASLKSADQIVPAKLLIAHPKYKTLDGNDIAVAVLNGTMTGPFATLPNDTTDRLTFGDSVTVVGFGLNDQHAVTLPNGTQTAFIPPRLYEVAMSVGKAGTAPCPRLTSNPSSQQQINSAKVYPPKELCVIGDPFYVSPENTANPLGVGFEGTCQGDSGGPLFRDGIQHGVTSRGLEQYWCAVLNTKPFSVYTKVKAHMEDFIVPLMEQYGIAA